jgi:putative membrane protein
MKLLLRLVVGAVGLFLTVMAARALHIDGLYLAPNANGAFSALAAILVLALVNAFIRPIVRFLFAGLNCLTLGLFSFVINALMFLLVGAISDRLHLSFHVNGFFAALFGSVCLSVITGLLGLLVPDRDDRGPRR